MKKLENPYEGNCCRSVKLEDFTHYPSNLEILPGIRQLDDGRLYQLARYPSGKTVMLPYSFNGAPPARMIPVAEPAYLRVDRTKGLTTTGFGSEERHPVVHRPQRMMVLHARQNGKKEVEKVALPNAVGQELADRLRPFCISPDLGSTWKPVGRVAYDHYFQYHIDEEKT